MLGLKLNNVSKSGQSKIQPVYDLTKIKFHDER